jgi:small subunit ribosomal protein S16
MLVIRLFRVGRRNQPSFKLVVTDKRRSSTRGRFVEEVGFYNPVTKEKVLRGERIQYWISVGAKPSPTVHNMLVADKIIEGKKIPKHTLAQIPAPPETAAKSPEEKPSPTPAPKSSA